MYPRVIKDSYSRVRFMSKQIPLRKVGLHFIMLLYSHELDFRTGISSKKLSPLWYLDLRTLTQSLSSQLLWEHRCCSTLLNTICVLVGPVFPTKKSLIKDIQLVAK